MSQVTRIACVFCSPSDGDWPTRKPVNVTSQELAELITHIIEMHGGPSVPTVEEVVDAVVKKLDARNATKVPERVPPVAPVAKSTDVQG